MSRAASGSGAVLAAAKLNLFLKILGRRADGYHDLSSLVCFADFGDRLVFEKSDEDDIRITGPMAGALAAAGGETLMAAARDRLRQAGLAIPPVTIHLDKQLPVGGGLGGGSADGAAVLRGLPAFYDQQLASARLGQLAASLGADLPACLGGGWLHVTGTGTSLARLAAPVEMPYAVLANPGVHLATGPVFAKWQDKPASTADPDWKAALANWDWPALIAIGNDLAQPAIGICPRIGTLLAAIDAGANSLGTDFYGAGMSGSGASCFALLARRKAADQLANRLQRQGFWAVSCRLLAS